MPAVATAIGASIAGAGTLGAAVISGGIQIAAGIGLSYAAKALAGKPKAASGGIQGSARTGGTVPRSILVGEWATAGSLVYQGSWGRPNKTPNAFLVAVYALSDVPSDSLRGVIVDGASVSFSASDPSDSFDGVNLGIPISDYDDGGKHHLWVKFYDGSQTTADAYLINKFGSGARAWTSNHKLTGVTYVIVTARWNAKLFGGFPDFRFVIRGAKLYDITKDTSAGGSGSQRWATPSTWAWSDNPAVILYNLMRGVSYGGTWLYGLQTVTGPQLPYSSWSAAINECNTLVTNADASTEKQFRAGGEIILGDEPGDVIESFLRACNGRIADVGYGYRIKVGAAGTATFAFTDDSLLATDEHTFTPFPAPNDLVNGIQPSYVSSEEGWVPKSGKLRTSDTYITADGGRRLVADVSYDRVSAKRQVQRLAKAALLEERRFRRHVIVLPADALSVEPLDFVAWTSARNGYSSKLFRVDQVTVRSDLAIVLLLREVDPSDYSWTAGSDEVTIPDGSIAVIRPAAQAIKDWAASAITFTGDDGRLAAGIRLQWDPDVEDVDLVEFEVRRSTGQTIVHRGNTPFVDAGAIDISQNIVGATTYQARGRYGSTRRNRTFTWGSWISVTTPSVLIPLSSLAASLAQLINDGSAAGKAIMQQVTPAPSGFDSLFRISLYGTANTRKTSGLYLYIDDDGNPGVLFDVTRAAFGSLSKHSFPFVLEDGIAKLRRANIQLLQAGQIDAEAIGAKQIKAGSITADHIKFRGIETDNLALESVARVYSDAELDIHGSAAGYYPNIAITVPFTAGLVFATLTFTYGISAGSAMQMALVRTRSGKSTTYEGWQEPGWPSPITGRRLGRASMTFVDQPPVSKTPVDCLYRLRLFANNVNDDVYDLKLNLLEIQR